LATTGTAARFNLELALKDVSLLLRHHDQANDSRAGRPDRSLEVFKRSALILTLTAWESYIEDTITNEFLKRLNNAASPRDISSAFNHYADKC